MKNYKYQKTKKVDIKDYYPMYVDLCHMHGFPALNIENIDEVFVHFKDNIITHSCFLWNTGSKMALIGFPLSNLALESGFRDGCLSVFIRNMCEQIKESGYNIIWTTSATDRVIAALEENNFQKGDEKVETYIKVVS